MADDTSATYPDDCVYNTHHVWARLVKEPRLKGIVTLVDNKPPKPSKSRKPAKGKVAEEVAAKAAAPSKSSKKAAPKKSAAAPAKPAKKASKKMESAPVVEAAAPAKPVKKASKNVEAAPAKPVKKASKNVEAAPVVEAVAPAKPVKKASKNVEAAPVVEAVAPAKPVKKAAKIVEPAPVVEAVAPAKPVKKASKASKSRGKGAVAPKPLVEYDMEEYDNVAYVGITDYLADELGGIDSIDVPLEGDELEMDSLVIHIHVRNRIRHFRCPLTGRVLAVNQDVLDDPALIYLDWHEAWLFKMEYDDPDETSQLMNGQQYTRYLDSL